jgi:hypothetical protein
LNEVELVSALDYIIETGNGLQETVQLEQTTVFRLGGDRWLLSPPNLDFWGETKMLRGYYLTIAYPERDTAIVNRLGADLEGLLAAFCSSQGNPTCPIDFEINILFATGPESWNDISNPAVQFDEEYNITLPAPTLVGLPRDDLGYQAILRGYGVYILTSLVMEGLDWHCCEKSLFLKVFLDSQFKGIGFHHEPRRQIESFPVDSLEKLEKLWNKQPNWFEISEENQIWLVYGLIDFLLEELPEATIAKMQTDLLKVSSLNEWLLLISDGQIGLNNKLEDDLHQYLQIELTLP